MSHLSSPNESFLKTKFKLVNLEGKTIELTCTPEPKRTYRALEGICEREAETQVKSSPTEHRIPDAETAIIE